MNVLRVRHLMSSTLLRLGLWVGILVLALYVVHETYHESTIAEMIPIGMLQKALGLAGVLLAAGVVARMFEKTSKVVSKNRCRVCGTAVPPGAIYCRAHLRTVLEQEDRKTHMTRIR
jgi:predicted nucleic acid-binding Zn ribbon protein